MRWIASRNRTFFILSLLFLLCANATSLTIAHGPYLQDMSDTAVTVMWATDEPSIGKVDFGEELTLSNSSEDIHHGVLKVTKLHSVRLSNLKPGTEYSYKVTSTEVLDFKPLFPVSGQTDESEQFTFTTFDSEKMVSSFLVVTDIHSDIEELNKFLSYTDWDDTDFLVMCGDILDDFSAKDSAKIYSNAIDPCVNNFASESPFLFVRGNHEMRGSLSPHIYKYFPNSSGGWYYGFSQGPSYYYVFDSGEDKRDDVTNFGGLIRCEPYRAEQKVWFQNHAEKNKPLFSEAFPFKVAFVHDPNWGYGANFDDEANGADINLLIGGHTHSYKYATPGNGRDFHTLVLARHQCAKVVVTATATETVADVTVMTASGAEYSNFQIVTKGKGTPLVQDKKIEKVDSAKNQIALSNTLKVKGTMLNFPDAYNEQLKEVEVYQLNGKLLSSFQTSLQQVNLASQGVKNMHANGFYIVKVKNILSKQQ